MNMDFAPSPGAAFSLAFDEFVSDAIKRKHDADDAAYRAGNPDAMRPAIGAGRLGNDCLRAIAYEFHRTPKDPERQPSGRLFRIFDRGHLAEEKMAEYLRLAGFTLLTENKHGKQFRFDAVKYEDGKGRIKGMIDGVLTGGPEFIIAGGAHHKMAYPAVWENKELGSKGWNKLAKAGLRKYGGDYWSQIHLGMAYLEIDHCLFTAKNADTQEIYAELVPLDAGAAQAASDKGARVVATRTPDEMPRIAKERTDFRCRFCDFAETCWSEQSIAPAPQATPAWMGGGQ